LDLRKSNIEDENSGFSSTSTNLSNPSMVCQVPSKTGGVQVAALENDVNSLKLDLSMQAAIGRIFLSIHYMHTFKFQSHILFYQETEIALTISLKKIQTMMTKLPVFQENVILPLKPRIVRKDMLLRNLIPFTAEFILNL
jgi:hypothetical protein